MEFKFTLTITNIERTDKLCCMTFVVPQHSTTLSNDISSHRSTESWCQCSVWSYGHDQYLAVPSPISDQCWQQMVHSATTSEFVPDTHISAAATFTQNINKGAISPILHWRLCLVCCERLKFLLYCLRDKCVAINNNTDSIWLRYEHVSCSITSSSCMNNAEKNSNDFQQNETLSESFFCIDDTILIISA